MPRVHIIHCISCVGWSVPSVGPLYPQLKESYPFTVGWRDGGYPETRATVTRTEELQCGRHGGLTTITGMAGFDPMGMLPCTQINIIQMRFKWGIRELLLGIREQSPIGV